MTKKDYEAIAKVFAGAKQPNNKEDAQFWFNAGLKWAAYELCPVFYADNPRFDRERFLKACGL